MSSNRRFIVKEGYTVVTITLSVALFLVIIGENFLLKTAAIVAAVVI